MPEDNYPSGALRPDDHNELMFPCCGGSDENPPEHCQDCTCAACGRDFSAHDPDPPYECVDTECEGFRGNV
jgi:hypothetical protein